MKISYNNTIKKTALPSKQTYSELAVTVTKVFPDLSPEELEVSYLDDNDIITVTDDADVQTMLESNIPNLKINVVKKIISAVQSGSKPQEYAKKVLNSEKPKEKSETDKVLVPLMQWSISKKQLSEEEAQLLKQFIKMNPSAFQDRVVIRKAFLSYKKSIDKLTVAETIELHTLLQVPMKKKKCSFLNIFPIMKNYFKSIITVPKRTPIVYKCDGCFVSPIEGHRYHSKTLDNFDLCEKCFEEVKQKEMFICFLPKELEDEKMNKKKNRVKKMKKLHASDIKRMRKRGKLNRLLNKLKQQEELKATTTADPILLEKLNGQIVKEISSIPTDSTSTNKKIYKTYLIKNTGTVAWNNCYLQLKESWMKFKTIKLPCLMPDEEGVITVVIPNIGYPKFEVTLEFHYENVQFGGNYPVEINNSEIISFQLKEKKLNNFNFSIKYVYEKQQQKII